jgi:hypothetical protein
MAASAVALGRLVVQDRGMSDLVAQYLALGFES